MGIFDWKTKNRSINIAELITEFPTSESVECALRKTLKRFPTASTTNADRFTKSFFKNLRKELQGQTVSFGE